MRFVAAFLCLVGTAVVASTVWYFGALKPVDAADQTRIVIEVEEGMSVDAIASLLAERGAIRSPFAFKVFVRLHGAERGLQAGKFVVRPSQSIESVVEVLQTGKAQELAVTIPEGFTLADIDALLASKGFTSSGALTACAQTCDLSPYAFLPNRTGLAERGGAVEGYLYPDTYFVASENFSPEAFLRRLLDTFRSRIVEGYAEDIRASGRSLHEIVTMASLIEEEASGDAERPVIAGILWKRYDDGRGLGVDATVRYITNKPMSALTVEDLNAESPYNTRKFRGLPPGPIANPGEASIRAALHPTRTEYWYYLHDRKGKIHYAVTNEEHNINRYMYLR